MSFSLILAHNGEELCNLHIPKSQTTQAQTSNQSHINRLRRRQRRQKTTVNTIRSKRCLHITCFTCAYVFMDVISLDWRLPELCHCKESGALTILELRYDDDESSIISDCIMHACELQNYCNFRGNSGKILNAGKAL